MSTVSITGEEYVCYGENSSGQFTPLIGVVKYDGTFSFREMTKDDLDRIPDDEILPGCWLFRKTMGSGAQGAWVKRFSLIRGGFIFLFHSPQNDKPLAIIPLEKCRIITPDRQEKSFDINNMNNSDGFEFDIRHKSRPTVRCYALSELERQELVRACNQRCDLPSNISDMLQVQMLLKNMPLSSTIRVSNTKLTGVNFAASEIASEAHSPFQSPYANRKANPPFSRNDSNNNNKSSNNFNNNPFAAPRPVLLDDDEGDEEGTQTPPPPPPPPLPTQSTYSSSINRSSFLSQSTSSPAPPPPPPPPLVTHQRLLSSLPSRHFSETQQSDNTSSHFQPPLPLSPLPADTSTTSPASSAVKKLDVSAFANLDSHLTKKVSDTTELREREDTYQLQQKQLQRQQQPQLVYEIDANDNSVHITTVQDTAGHGSSAANDTTTTPFSLAEAFRLLLFFCDEEMAEDPQPTSLQQFPHAKGAAVDEMLLYVYRSYCSSSTSTSTSNGNNSNSNNNDGFMSLEQLVDFLRDCAVLQTHAPHDSVSDEATETFVDALDAVNLLRSLPQYYKNTSSSETQGGRVDFGMWYQVLLRVSAIVYDELYVQDATVAFSKLLFEVITPLYLLCHRTNNMTHLYPNNPNVSRHRRALLQSDTLLQDARVLLAMILYAPNLWKVFLTYATDAVGKIPELGALPFPVAAQLNERGLHKLPSVAPEKHLNHSSSRIYSGLNPDSWIVGESGFMRCARDYGLSPYVASVAEVREIYRSVNTLCHTRRFVGSDDTVLSHISYFKTVVSSKLPSREQLVANNALRSTKRQQSSATSSGANKESMYFGRKTHRGAPPSISPSKFSSLSAINAKSVNVNPADLKNKDLPPLPSSPPPPQTTPSPTENAKNKTANLGLSFSEFVEAMALIAVKGLQQENYHLVFPTVYSKVLALLTVWGLADLKKLEEVRFIRSEEAY